MSNIKLSGPATRGINGRRGAFELLFAVVYVVIGLSFLFMPPSSSRADALRWLTDLLPLWPFASIWVVAGLTGAYSAFLSRPKDWIGFFALTLAPFAWGCLFLIGIPLGSPLLGAVGGLVYWLLSAATMVVSGMQGPTDRDTREMPS
jgi:hypothetical protein